MDQFEKDYEKETGEECYLLGEILMLNPYNNNYVEYLKSRLKDA